MNNVRDFKSARFTILAIQRRLDEIARIVQANPGLVRIARDASGDQIAFWNNGSAVEYNISKARRLYTDIAKAYPNAVKSRSGEVLRIELPL